MTKALRAIAFGSGSTEISILRNPQFVAGFIPFIIELDDGLKFEPENPSNLMV